MGKTTLKGLALAASALAPLAPAWAQDSADGASAGDIVVTARRVEEKLQDVPISITVFNQEQLATRNIVNTTELAIYTPSLAANTRFGTEKATFAIRSFTQDLNTAPTVGVYFADVVAPRLASNIPSGGGAGVGQMFDLQNVQVLKGPQGTLFGRNTTGGAILLVPQKPTDRLEGYIEGTYGTYNARRLQAVVNVPLSDSFKIRLGLDRNLRDGYLNNKSGIGPAKFNDLNYWSVRVSALADLTPDLQNYTIFTWSKTDTSGMIGRIQACNRQTVAGSTGFFAPTRAGACAMLDRVNQAGHGFYDVEGNLPNPFVIQEFWQAINTTTWDVTDNLTVKNIISYARAKESYSFNITGDNIPGVYVTNTFPGPNGVGQDNRANFTEELQIQGDTSDGKLTWQIGGYLERSTPQGGQFGAQQQYTSVYAVCPDGSVYQFRCSTASVAGSISIANNVYTFRTHGLYAQATYQLTDKFAFTAGIRNTWEYAAVDANNVRIVPTVSGTPASVVCSRAATPSPNPGLGLVNNPACTRSFKSESNRPTWLLNLDYKPSEDVLIYVKWARGFRGGAVNEANFGAETWNPEKLDLYELGMKASFDGAISGNVNIAGFWNKLKDQQTTVSIPACTNAATCAPTGINGIQNVATSEIKGIELEGTLKFSSNFRLDFGYAYLDAKVTGGSVPFCDNTRFLCAQAAFLTAGTRSLFAPENRVTFSATYDLPVDDSIGDISLGLTFVHTDQQVQTYGTRTPFLQGVIPEDYGLLPATDLLNASINWKKIGGSDFDLALFMTNVTNEKYRVAAAGGLASTGAEFILTGEPRMFGARLKYNFGR